MRSVHVFSISLLAVLPVPIPRHGANASERSGFVEWAIDQGEEPDNTWNRITTGATHGAMKGSSTNPVGRSVSFGRISRESSSVESGDWVHTDANFIHRVKLEFFPLSTRKRSSPGRGMHKLTHPARAQLGRARDSLRIQNEYVPRKHFSHSRTGRQRIVPRMGNRFSTFQRRSRGWSRPSSSPARPRKSR